MKRMLLPLLPLLLAASPPLPRVVMVSESDYPKAARQAGVEGDVRFDLLIDAKGKPSGCTITAGADLPASLAADTCAMAVKRWRFVPARDDQGQKVAGQRSYSFAWRMAGSCPAMDNETICVRLD